jgi:hypothetical protein
MKTQYLMAVAVTVLLASPALATSVSSPALELKAATDSPTAEKIQYRRCWWENGYQVCDRYGGPGVYDGWNYYDAPAYGWRTTPARPEDYPTGSRRWWDEMGREDRAGSGGR